jgi:hypothetical protein
VQFVPGQKPNVWEVGVEVARWWKFNFESQEILEYLSSANVVDRPASGSEFVYFVLSTPTKLQEAGSAFSGWLPAQHCFEALWGVLIGGEEAIVPIVAIMHCKAATHYGCAHYLRIDIRDMPGGTSPNGRCLQGTEVPRS